jgi:ketosteroid isomerase-like protein
MKRLFLISILFLFLFGCGPQKLTKDQVDFAKNEIQSMITQINGGYNSRDVEKVTNLFSTSNPIVVFGTDSAEVIKSIDVFQNQLKKDFQLFESIKFEELRNLSIQISEIGDMGSAVYEVPVNFIVSGQSTHMLLRFANTWKKENRDWRVIHWLAYAASEGQSSTELVEKTK